MLGAWTLVNDPNRPCSVVHGFCLFEEIRARCATLVDMWSLGPRARAHTRTHTRGSSRGTLCVMHETREALYLLQINIRQLYIRLTQKLGTCHKNVDHLGRPSLTVIASDRYVPHRCRGGESTRPRSSTRRVNARRAASIDRGAAGACVPTGACAASS